MILSNAKRIDALTPLAGPLLQRLDLRHGPPDILTNFLLAAERVVRERGATLEIGNFDDMARVNAQHYDSWGRLVTMFDPRVAPIPADRAICIIGRDSAGDIAVTQATRLYDFAGTTLALEVASNRLFYPDSRPPPHERCEVTATSAQTLDGLAIYSGALWIRPDFRRRNLSPVLARIGRSLAFALHGATIAFSFARNELVTNGVAAGYGYKHFENSFRRFVADRLDFEGSYLWATDRETFADIEQFTATELAGGSLSDAKKQYGVI